MNIIHKMNLSEEDFNRIDRLGFYFGITLDEVLLRGIEKLEQERYENEEIKED